AFLYWPERQFLELVYAPLQAETAEVTLLGTVVEGLEELATFAAELRASQDREAHYATLRQVSAGPDATSEGASDGPQKLVAARKAIWRTCPTEIERLLQSRAIMHPAGPLFMAEGELRVLHETLWKCRIGWKT